jgi:excisionase family DNA binding protein
VTDKLISIQAASEVAGVSVRTVRRWISQGILPARRVGPKLVRVYASDISRIVRPIPTAGGDAA